MSRFNVTTLVVLYVLVVALALLVVANRHEARRLFADVQKLEQERDALRADWSRLKLEHSTLLNQVHVETQAKQRLGMTKPSASELKVIRE
ncbi:cell division protein FtsL [Candidatus Thiothrix anitrata]|jgi:cell division protein FtsL|uniref:Cell division protein FtsL n=1 Tax=Candidatus Thiothrix anitrata TaxID=2823902 RepID=A0ABX7X673_9GAMM|nr:cell division protein FtsL [Candidatus Thiothrix anitrata]QTR50213.1 cell division protein FtsL [Candidatus Thiothrix anitrata]